MKIIRSLIFSYIFLLSHWAFSQQEASNWYFGENAGITFDLNSGNIINQNNGSLNTREGCATISDDFGNLLFYTDGTYVWDKNHAIMPGGTGLYGDSSSAQSAIIVPKPNDNFLYYIFTVDNDINGFDFGLNYSVVDMSRNGGSGEIIQKNFNLLEKCSEKITAVLKDCISDSIWLIAFASENGDDEIFDTYHAYEISNSGINPSAIKSTFNLAVFDARGYLKLSPDGTKVASANATNGLYIYDFDNQTGKLSNEIYLFINANNNADMPYGVEFSPNSRLLYVHSSNDYFNLENPEQSNNPTNHFSTLTQFNLSANNIQNSEITIDDRNLYRGALQLGPNGKIYRALSATYIQGLPYLGVINNPDVVGLGCDYQHNAVNLSPNASTQGLPPFISSFFNTEIDIIKNGESSMNLNLCNGDTYILTSEYIDGATYQWTKNGLAIPQNTFDLEVSEGGLYEVYIEPNNGDCAIEGQAFVIYNENPVAYDASLLQCDEDGIKDGNTLFNLNEANTILTGGLEGLSTKFYSDVSRTIELQADNYSNISNPQIIYVEVINDNTGCKDFSQLLLEISVTDANDITLKPECDNDGIEDGLYTFDLSTAKTAIIKGFSSSLNVFYYETYEDALLEQNSLGSSYTSKTPYKQTIFARVEDDNNCFGISSVELIVHKLPNIDTEDIAYYCLNKFPEPIDINAKILEGSVSEYVYEWDTGEVEYKIQVNEVGEYVVNVYNSNGCSKQRIVSVKPSNLATFTKINITDVTQNNIIEILVNGEGFYEYALYDKSNIYLYRGFQESNVFENVSPGFYTVRVRDVKNNCGTVSDLVSVIGFPKYFTPNNDGTNDTWQVYGVSDMFQPNSKILIYDRYGKLITQIDPKGSGWDGFFNGNKLPSDDYWFAVTLQDGRVFKGHFTLKR